MALLFYRIPNLQRSAPTQLRILLQIPSHLTTLNKFTFDIKVKVIITAMAIVVMTIYTIQVTIITTMVIIMETKMVLPTVLIMYKVTTMSENMINRMPGCLQISNS